MAIPAALDDGVLLGPGPWGDLARQMYAGSYRLQFAQETPSVNRARSPIVLHTLRDFRASVIRLLRTNTQTVEAKSRLNANIVGMHKLVLYDDPCLQLRIYVVPPDRKHRIHTDWQTPFFYHHHRYDYLSAPLEGIAINQRLILDQRPGSTWAYRIAEKDERGKDEPPIARSHRVSLSPLPIEVLSHGEGYLQEAPEIHRASFIPDPKTGWSIVLLYEFRDRIEMPYMFCDHEMPDIPDRRQLFKKPNSDELAGLIARTLDVLRLPTTLGAASTVSSAGRSPPPHPSS